MKKTGLLLGAVILVVGGIYVTYGGIESPAGYATGAASGKTDTLVRDLRSRNRKVRRSAAGALGRTGDLTALKALTAALEDDDMAVAQQARKSINRIVKRFPKNLPPFSQNRFALSLAAIINETGEGGDKLAAAVKDGLLGQLLQHDNIEVGSAFDFDDETAAGVSKTVALDVSGKLESVAGGECVLELDLALTDVGVVVKRFEKIRAGGDSATASAEACGAAAGKKLLSLLGAR